MYILQLHNLTVLFFCNVYKTINRYSYMYAPQQLAKRYFHFLKPFDAWQEFYRSQPRESGRHHVAKFTPRRCQHFTAIMLNAEAFYRKSIKSNSWSRFLAVEIRGMKCKGSRRLSALALCVSPKCFLNIELPKVLSNISIYT